MLDVLEIEVIAQFKVVDATAGTSKLHADLQVSCKLDDDELRRISSSSPDN